jgi:hypothetical protein
MRLSRMSGKLQTVVLFLKKEKVTMPIPASYRSISMSAYNGNLMKSLMACRLIAAVFKCGVISRTQMEGVRDNSAADALIYTLTPISNALKIPLGKSCQIPLESRPSMLRYNIEKAFNSNPKILVPIMQQRQMPSYLVNWT